MATGIDVVDAEVDDLVERARFVAPQNLYVTAFGCMLTFTPISKYIGLYIAPIGGHGERNNYLRLNFDQLREKLEQLGVQYLLGLELTP